MTIPEAEELLTLVEKRAEGLRKVGVLTVEIGAVKFTLSRFEPEAPRIRDEQTEEEMPKNPLDDPETFGRSRVPKREGQS